MRLDDLPESGNVEDRRAEGGYGGGGGFGLPIGGGGLGIGTIVVLGLIGWALGIDPSRPHRRRRNPDRSAASRRCRRRPTARRTGTPQDDMGRFVSQVLGSTELQWKQVFAKDGKTYRAPVLVLYRGATQAQCGGVAQSAMGPFYCPVDQKVYLDTSFFDQIATRFRGCDVGSKSCQFSAGLRDRARGRPPRAEPARHPAEGAAGAARGRQQSRGQPHPGAGRVAGRLPGRRVGEPRERKSAETRASRRSSSRATSRPPCAPRPRSGTIRCRSAHRATWCPIPSPTAASEQRQRWFNTGFKSGTVASCNTFAAAQL